MEFSMNKEALDDLDIKQMPPDDKIFIYAVFWNDRPMFRLRWSATGFPLTTSLKKRALSDMKNYFRVITYGNKPENTKLATLLKYDTHIRHSARIDNVAFIHLEEITGENLNAEYILNSFLQYERQYESRGFKSLNFGRLKVRIPKR